jgi:signal transduction histidine kinase
MKNIKIFVWILRISMFLLSSLPFFLTFIFRNFQYEFQRDYFFNETKRIHFLIYDLKKGKIAYEKLYPYLCIFLTDTSLKSDSIIWGEEFKEDLKSFKNILKNYKYEKSKIFLKEGIIFQNYSPHKFIVFVLKETFPFLRLNKFYNFSFIISIIWLFVGFLMGFLISLPYERIYFKLKKGEIEGIEFLKDFLKKEDIEKIEEEKNRKEREEKFMLISEVTSSFLHEIRNSLASLNALLSLIEIKDKELSKSFLPIKQEIKNLAESLFSFNEIIRTKKIRDLKKINLKEILKEVIDDFLSRFKEKKYEIENKATDFEIFVSPFLIKRAIFNIIKNSYEAIEDNGKIEIYTRLKDNIISLIFEDDGCGMGEEEMKKAFLPFFTKKEGGLGLGLSFVKKVMELHDGDVFLEKREPKGLRVILNFKIR